MKLYILPRDGLNFQLVEKLFSQRNNKGRRVCNLVIRFLCIFIVEEI